ncbi:MAG: methyltransferase, partial [Pseudomonadota bacterium]
SLCLLARVPGAQVTGVELQSDYAALARENGAEADFTVYCADVAALPVDLRQKSYDHVMFNPPWYTPGTVEAPADPGRCVAHVGAMAPWFDVGLRRLRPGGTVTVIQRAERLGDMLSALGPQAGSVQVLPLASRVGRDAGRVVVRAVKGGRGALRLRAPMVVHRGESHRDGDSFSDAARAVLRDGAAISWH